MDGPGVEPEGDGDGGLAWRMSGAPTCQNSCGWYLVRPVRLGARGGDGERMQGGVMGGGLGEGTGDR